VVVAWKAMRLEKPVPLCQEKAPMTVTYDTSEESNQNLGIGLGCNGVIDVLIEPVASDDLNNPIAQFNSVINTKGTLRPWLLFLMALALPKNF
jgi:xanthine/CO dehydrogenase XdhC/CoxF family maturation factor